MATEALSKWALLLSYLASCQLVSPYDFLVFRGHMTRPCTLKPQTVGLKRGCVVTREQPCRLSLFQRAGTRANPSLLAVTHIALTVDGLQQPVLHLLRGCWHRCHCLFGAIRGMEGGILRNGNPATVETQRPARSLVKRPPSIIFRRLQDGRPHIFFAFSHGVGNACAVLAVARCLLGALATHYQLRDLSTAYCCMLGYDVGASAFSRRRVNIGRRRRPPTHRVYLQVQEEAIPRSRRVIVKVVAILLSIVTQCCVYIFSWTLTRPPF